MKEKEKMKEKKIEPRSLLKAAVNEQAFAKVAIRGFSGSGKTFTASKFAIGLHQYIKSKKPVAFFDTETGSDFVLPMFKDAKIDLLVMKSKSFIDALNTMKEAEKKCSILIIDSISHVWKELCESFQDKMGAKRLLFQHWGPIKREFSQLTSLFVSSQLHIFLLGRAGWEYDFTEDEDGHKDLIKTGTRMKTEIEMEYETSLLIEMERVRLEEGKIGGTHIHRAWVIKDRANKINGKYFDDPDFNFIIPHIEYLNLGGKHQTTDPSSRSSQDLFEKKDSAGNLYKRAQIALELIQNELVLRYPGRSGEDNIAKLKILKDTFRTHSWEAIKILPVEVLEEGASKIAKMPQVHESGTPDKNAPADLCKEITNYAGVNDISIPKFLRKWSEGKIFKLTDLRTSELQQFFADMKKLKK